MAEEKRIDQLLLPALLPDELGVGRPNLLALPKRRFLLAPHLRYLADSILAMRYFVNTFAQMARPVPCEGLRFRYNAEQILLGKDERILGSNCLSVSHIGTNN